MLEFGTALDTGRTRLGRENQDNIVINKKQPFAPLLVLADGMGGYKGGAEASRLVIEAFSQVYDQANNAADRMEMLNQAVLSAHEKIIIAGFENPDFANMGSTVVAAIVDLKQNEINLVNVGDSRAYLLHASGIRQISYDQSEVAELERQGALSSVEVSSYKRKNVLTMSLSANRSSGSLKPYFSRVPFLKDSVLLLCSDGLWGSVPQALIQMAALELKPQDAADKLVRLANDFGGPDNISVIIVRRFLDHFKYHKSQSISAEETWH